MRTGASGLPRIPRTSPTSYKTLAGLLDAVERVLFWRLRGVGRFAGLIDGQYLANAEWAARENFGDTTSIPALRAKYAITRRQDLVGGDAVFGIPLPKRPYDVGDNVPGVGEISDKVELPGGAMQFKIGGEWFHERCFDRTA